MIALVLDSFFLAALLLLFALQEQKFLVAGTVVCAFYAFFRRGLPSVDLNHLLLVLAVGLLLWVPVLRLDHDVVPLFYLLSTFATYYAAKRFSSFSLNHVQRCLTAVFWLSFSGIVFGVVSHWDSAEPIGEIIPGASTNGLPSYLIILQVTLSVAFFLERHKLPIFSPIATFVVAVLGLGRGSIIVALMILLFSFFVNGFVIARSRCGLYCRLISGVFALGLILFVGWTLFIGGAVDDFIEGSKFSSGVLDEHRGYMVSDYLGKIDFWSFLFGADYSGTSIISNYGGNPHNTFIRLHSFYGVWGLFLVFLSMFCILMANQRRATKFVTFFLLLFVLIRAVTEPILFPSLLDFFYFLCFFVFFRNAPATVSRGGALCLKQ